MSAFDGWLPCPRPTVGCRVRVRLDPCSSRSYKRVEPFSTLVIDIGIVGCGVIGNRLAAAIDSHNRYELAAACDLDADRAADRDFVAEYLDSDATGNGRRLGEIALVDATSRIGLSGRTYFDTLLDENASTHIAFGQGFSGARTERPARGVNQSMVHLDVMIGAIVDDLAPTLVARNSIGHIGAAQLLLTAGDNPERLRSEASFAALCGVSPIPASSGKTIRHRLNRGGDRAANSALHIIAIGRLRTDPKTKAYVARRMSEGHSKLDAIRAVKRYIAREVFTIIKRRQQEINQSSIDA